MTEELPIKQHLANISTTIGTLQRSVAEQHKQLEQMKQELSIIEYKIQDPFREIREYFDLAKTSIIQGFDKDCGIFDEEVQFLKQQIDTVTQDKLKIIQTGFKVDANLREIAQDIGIETEQLFVI